MSRIAVVTSSPPMVEGGHMVIARELVRALREAGHRGRDHRDAAEPLRPSGLGVLRDLADRRRHHRRPADRSGDSLRFPSYAVRHERHVCWLNHTMREYYDLWDRFSAAGRARPAQGAACRRTPIHVADRYLLTRNVTKLFVQSRTIQQRLTMWPELQSTVLYPPAPQRPYRCEATATISSWCRG